MSGTLKSLTLSRWYVSMRPHVKDLVGHSHGSTGLQTGFCRNPMGVLLHNNRKYSLSTSRSTRHRRIHSEVFGEVNEEGKAPVFIAHGLMGSGTNFQSIAKAVNKQTKRQIIVYDARNHGISFHAPTMSYQDMSDDLCDLIKGHSTNQEVVLMGHSMGGRTVMFTALSKPELVQQLIVVDVSPVNIDFSTMDSTEWNMAHFFHAMKAVTFMQPSETQGWSISKARKNADEQLSHRIKDPGLRQWLLMNMVLDPQTKVVRWRHNLEVIHHAFETDVRTFPDFDPSVTFDKKTTFIGGALSEYLPVSDHPEILERFPKATFDYIEGAGHWVHSQKPAEFIQLVLQHLQ